LPTAGDFLITLLNATEVEALPRGGSGGQAVGKAIVGDEEIKPGSRHESGASLPGQWSNVGHDAGEAQPSLHVPLWRHQ